MVVVLQPPPHMNIDNNNDNTDDNNNSNGSPCYLDVVTNSKGRKDEEAAPEEEIIGIENLGRRGSSSGGPRRGMTDEATPLHRLSSLNRRQSLLTRQTSIMDTPIITDASGAMKLTFWV